MGPKQKKEPTEGATGPGRITRADRKVESNDSPQIPDREPEGGWHQKRPASLRASFGEVLEKVK